MPKPLTPTTRTVRWLEERGYLVDVVERRIPKTFITRDLFGFIDILAVDERGGVTAVQATSKGNVSSRVKKIGDHENLARVRKAGWSLWVMGWDGKPEPRIVDVS